MSTIPGLHPSTRFHFWTETAVLTTLLQRARAQHRAQLFLRRLVGVVRLARRVGGALAQDDSDALRSLVPVLTAALVKAAGATRRMLELHHFMPLQTVLLASYARLYAVAVGLGRSVGLEGHELGLGVEKPAVELAPPELPELEGIELLGERVERVERPVASPKRLREDTGSAVASASASPAPRPALAVEAKRPKAVPATADSPRPKKVVDGVRPPVAADPHAVPKPKKLKAVDTPPAAATPDGAPKTAKAKTKTKTKTKKKRDAMDDIFGF
ncbi:hypothetical protein Q8F55_006591 [Vanrija albida]|uniref:Uncharacterized protein n=1 Tax=Vanrija albida TaxID=181172 RepID=A0ABR3PXJ1_9TREE